MKSKYVIGLMSGTSVDGIDASLIKINPDLSFEEIHSIVYDFPEKIIAKIHSLFKETISIKELCSMNFLLGEYFAQAVKQLCVEADFPLDKVDLIGSHGQTIYHYPTEEIFSGFPLKSTLQIGEPSVIAERTNITTISDFRPRDIAAGGQGAPLVSYFDEIFFNNKEKSRAIQNIGGIGNVTVVSPNCDTFAFDTGPGNMLIDYFVKKYFSQPFDKGGEIAKSGKINNEWLMSLICDPYYKIHPPKSTGRELFSVEYAEKSLISKPTDLFRPEDIIATITALSAKSIKNAYEDFIFPKTGIDEIVLGGGGAYNTTLINLLKKEFDYKIQIKTHEDFGISAKFKEAIAFAMLAYTTYYNISNNCMICTGAKKPVVLGKIIPA